MDLKNTKATPVLLTKKPLKNGDRVLFTERPLPESKNGSISPHLETGWQCEQIALQVYQQHGYQILKQRWKTPFAEVDLFFRSPDGHWVMVEVKSLPSTEYLSQRLTRKQKMRLKRAFLWAIERWGAGEMHLAMVCGPPSRREVLIFTEIFD